MRVQIAASGRAGNRLTVARTGWQVSSRRSGALHGVAICCRPSGPGACPANGTWWYRGRRICAPHSRPVRLGRVKCMKPFVCAVLASVSAGQRHGVDGPSRWPPKQQLRMVRYCGSGATNRT